MKTSLSLLTRIGSIFVLILAGSASGLSAQPGSLDTTFDAIAAIAGQVGYSLAVQPDGKVIAIGSFGLMRFLPDGSVDTSFQPAPLEMVPSPGLGSRPGAVALQPDGRILVTGTFTNSAGATLPGLVRLNPDGSIDSSFNLDPGAHPNGRVLALQPDGKVLTGGSFIDPGGDESTGLMRLLADGSIDPDFDLGGFNESTDFYSLALARDGKIYFGTFSVLGRLNPDGTRDNSFNPEPNSGPYGAIAVQPDGKVLVGQYGDGAGYASMRRLVDSGADDPDWTVPGIDGGDHRIFAVLLQPDGKVLLGGNNLYAISGMPVASLGRLHPDGSVDASFNTDSELNYYSVENMALSPDGKVYVAGFHSAWPELGPGPGVWRLNNDTGLQPQLAIGYSAAEGIILRLSGFPGASYRLESREQITATGPWIPLTTLTLSDATAKWQDPEWMNSASRFYRAVWLP